MGRKSVKYKVRYKCARCGHEDITRAKSDASAPAHCIECGSTRTVRQGYSRVNR